MAYRLKSINYKNQHYNILLQNKNGPCPILAAANVLLLKKSIVLPSKCVGAGVVTIEELTNILAEKILTNNDNSRSRDYHVDEVLKIFPNLQFGMDVNPKFTAGPKGVEYTVELNAFDLLQIELVHGWLLEVDAQEYEWVGKNTYNQLVNLVIEGNDASTELQQKPDVDDCKFDELSNKATRGTIIRHFLDQSAHQLTQYGLSVLHEYIKEGDMVVFFRNNHYNALTKYEEHLYLLVTDFGYANVKSVVWEKLDVIDGDTEYVNGDFKVPGAMNRHVSAVATGEQLVTNNAQSQADYHLALQLSRESNNPSSVAAASTAGKTTETNSVRKMSEIERATRASLLEYDRRIKEKSISDGSADYLKDPVSKTASKLPSRENAMNVPTIAVGFPTANVPQEEMDMMLAIQLQRQEEKREERIRRAKPAAKDSSCVIS